MPFYDSEFEQRFGFSPHEGHIIRHLKISREKGEKWCIDKLVALYSWMLDGNRRSSLIYDSVRICQEINGKIARCGSLSSFERTHESDKNQRRLIKIIDAAESLYEERPNRTALKALVHASNILRDYETLVEILEERHVSQKHYEFVKRQLQFLGVPESELPLELRNHKRHERSKNKEEKLGTGEFYPSPIGEYNRSEVRQNYMAVSMADKDGMSEMEAILVGAATSDSSRELRF